MVMFKKYLLSSVAFAPENEQGNDPAEVKPVQTEKERVAAERAEIEVQNTNNEKPDDEGEEEGDEAEDKKEEVAAKPDGEVEEEEVEETDPVKLAAQKKELAEDKKKLEKTIARLQRRIDKETGSKTDLSKELDEAKKLLLAKEEAGEGKVLPDDIIKEATRIANEDRRRERLDNDCAKLADSADKFEKQLDIKLKALSEEIGPLPVHMIEIMANIDNGGEILAHLVNDVDLTEDLYKMPMAKLTVKLVKLGDELEAKRKPKPKPISQVPPPNRELDGSNRGTKVVLHDKMTDKEWIEKREADVRAKREGGRINLR